MPQTQSTTRTHAGFAALVHADVVTRLRQPDAASPEAARQPLLSWPEFKDLLSDAVDWPHRRMPFIFAGALGVALRVCVVLTCSCVSLRMCALQKHVRTNSHLPTNVTHLPRNQVLAPSTWDSIKPVTRS